MESIHNSIFDQLMREFLVLFFPSPLESFSNISSFSFSSSSFSWLMSNPTMSPGPSSSPWFIFYAPALPLLFHFNVVLRDSSQHTFINQELLTQFCQSVAVLLLELRALLTVTSGMCSYFINKSPRIPKFDGLLTWFCGAIQFRGTVSYWSSPHDCLEVSWNRSAFSGIEQKMRVVFM